MTASGALLCLVGDCLFLDIRTKDSFKGQMYIQAGLMFICSLNVCTCGAMSAIFYVD